MSYYPTNQTEKTVASYQKYGRATRKKQENFGYHPQVSGDHSAWYPTGGSEDIFSCCQTYLLFPFFNLSFTNTGLLSSFKSGKGGFAPSSKNLKASTNI